jgi:FkbM family methyltransferase
MSTKISALKRNRLIYDVGLHKGEDTEFYLKKGFSVIAFEADPEHVEFCKKKFAKEINKKELTIIEGAIVDYSILQSGQQKVNFYKNMAFSDWGTIVSEWAHRNEFLGTKNRIIEVNIVDFKNCLKIFGIPYYMKIDIEGADKICLKVLLDFINKPNFISIESEKNNFNKLEMEVSLLEELGYSGFKAIQQENIPAQKTPNPAREGRYAPHLFPEDSSGLFGEELPGKWKTKRQILLEYKLIFIIYKLFGDYSFLRHTKLGFSLIMFLTKMLKKPLPGWYDTHARLSMKDR